MANAISSTEELIEFLVSQLRDSKILLRRCLPLINAQAKADHMLDGFGPKSHLAIDGLLDDIQKHLDG